MRAAMGMALAVLVITGWFLALLWLVLTVSQTAVGRVAVTHAQPCVVERSIEPCFP